VRRQQNYLYQSKIEQKKRDEKTKLTTLYEVFDLFDILLFYSLMQAHPEKQCTESPDCVSSAIE
jgi:hypothetical protein